VFAGGLQQNALEVRAANCKTHILISQKRTHTLALARRETLTSFIALVEMEFLIISFCKQEFVLIHDGSFEGQKVLS
jgi:hypothetical protein